MVVRAGLAIQWVPIMGTILGAGSVGSILECRFTEVGWGVCAAVAGADFGFVDGLDDLEVPWLHMTRKGENVQSQIPWWYRGNKVCPVCLDFSWLEQWNFCYGSWGIHTEQALLLCHGRQSDIKKRGICFVAVIQIFHILIEKFEHAGLQMLSGSRLMKVVYLSLKVMRSSMGRLLMMLEFRSGVNTAF